MEKATASTGTRATTPAAEGSLPARPALSIDAPDSIYEKEADAMADKVMRMQMPGTGNFSSANNLVSRKCAHCEAEEKQLQRKESNNSNTGSVASSAVQNVLSSPGRPLDAGIRSFMEPRFNHDFSHVKVHTDVVAAKSASSINALAYTNGSNIVFNEGRYDPKTDEGKKLIAHELTHVVQQGNGSVSGENTSQPMLQREEGDEEEEEVDVFQEPEQAIEEAPAESPQDAERMERDPEEVAVREDTAEPVGPAERELSEEELVAMRPVAQAAATPDGNALGPVDATHKGCFTKFLFSGGTGSNNATSATGSSRVTATLQQAPGGGPQCDCGCVLFRQFIRGFWRAGGVGAAKRFDIGSCGTVINMNEASFTEEFEACNPGGVPIGPGCNRVYLDTPGFPTGLAEGTFVQMHLVLRYQLWDQCNGKSLGMADHTLDISGDKTPRRITFN